jgi:hypothetical protein
MTAEFDVRFLIENIGKACKSMFLEPSNIYDIIVDDDIDKFRVFLVNRIFTAVEWFYQNFATTVCASEIEYIKRVIRKYCFKQTYEYMMSSGVKETKWIAQLFINQTGCTQTQANFLADELFEHREFLKAVITQVLTGNINLEDCDIQVDRILGKRKAFIIQSNRKDREICLCKYCDYIINYDPNIGMVVRYQVV